MRRRSIVLCHEVKRQFVNASGIHTLEGGGFLRLKDESNRLPQIQRHGRDDHRSSRTPGLSMLSNMTLQAY